MAEYHGSVHQFAKITAGKGINYFQWKIVIFGALKTLCVTNLTFQKKSGLLWVLAVVITLSAAFYQRYTGPTNPKSLTLTVAGGQYTLFCPRSLRTEVTPLQAQGNWEGLEYTSVLKIKVKGKEGADPLPADTQVGIYYRRVSSNAPWLWAAGVVGAGGHIEVTLPSQPPAGKLSYFPEVAGDPLSKEAPLVIRFRNNVPAWVLVPHILLMYGVMLLSTMCGLLSWLHRPRWRQYVWLTLAALFVGGFILGPLVQKFAFGAYWTGWPWGDDLTDTKTLIAAIFWIVALLFSNKKIGRYLSMLAAIALLAIYSIPHSASGSQFNYDTGLVETE